MWTVYRLLSRFVFFFFQAEDGIRDLIVTGVQTCALPISALPARAARESRPHHRGIQPGDRAGRPEPPGGCDRSVPEGVGDGSAAGGRARSEEHTSELQSRSDLVCRLLLEKKKKKKSSRQLRRQRHPGAQRGERLRERPHMAEQVSMANLTCAVVAGAATATDHLYRDRQ